MIIMHIGLNFGWARSSGGSRNLLAQVVARYRMAEFKCIVNNGEKLGKTGLGTVSTETVRNFIKNVFALTSEAALSHKEDVICQE